MNRVNILLFVGFFLAGCKMMKPVRIHSDPNQERQERMEEKVEQDNIQAFIINHPELTPEMKKALRDGSMTRHEASDILRKQKSSQR